MSSPPSVNAAAQPFDGSVIRHLWCQKIKVWKMNLWKEKRISTKWLTSGSLKSGVNFWWCAFLAPPPKKTFPSPKYISLRNNLFNLQSGVVFQKNRSVECESPKEPPLTRRIQFVTDTLLPPSLRNIFWQISTIYVTRTFSRMRKSHSFLWTGPYFQSARLNSP